MLCNQTRQFKHCEGWRAGVGNVSLYFQRWHPVEKQPAKATVVIVHGLGSHSGLFQSLVDGLLTQNYCVYTFDLRGHGRSEGQRGYINRWDEYRDDLRQFVNWVQWQEGGRPCYVMGNSLGAAIALDYSLQFPDVIDGLILSAPAVSTQGISPLKLKVGGILSQVYPRFSLSTGFKKKQPSTRDEAVNAAYANDPLRHSRGTARLSTEFFQVNQQTWQNIGELELPTLVLQGAADVVAPVAVTRQFFGRMQGENKSLYVYPGGYHEICNDINRDQVIGDLLGWLGGQVPLAKVSARLEQSESLERLPG